MPRFIDAGVSRSHIYPLFIGLFVLVLVVSRWNHWGILVTPALSEGLPVSDPTGSTQKATLSVKLINRSKELKLLRVKVRNQNLRQVNLQYLKGDSILLTIHNYLDNIEVVCRRKIRMGNIDDGGWEICDDQDVRPREPCIVYSFGIKYDFSFDDDVASVYGCHVYSFDPSMYNVPDSYNRSSLVHFYKIGLYNQTTRKDPGDGKPHWRMDTLSGIRTMLGHSRITIDVLKMDIELAEWDALPEIISSGQLSTVVQLMVEFHVSGESRKDMLRYLSVIKALETAGFKRYHAHKNPACGVAVENFPVIRTNCYEVYYLRRTKL